MADDKVNKQIEELSKISRDDGKEKYAKAQFELGLIYEDKKHDYDKAEEHYLNIFREDATKFFANAQFNLAIIYQEKKQDYDKAELFYSNITKEDEPSIYAKAQFNLAFIYQEKKQDYDKAELFYSNITKEDEPSIYAIAQYKLALIYEEKKQDYDKAELFYSNITREDEPYIYAKAQFNLAIIYQVIKQDYDKAELFYFNITKEDEPSIYAIAQFSLALIYEEKKQDYDKAELFYSNITKEDEPFIYAIAQFNLAIIYQEKKQDYDKAELFYSNITREDEPKIYAFAQYNLALIYKKEKNDDDEAIKFFSNVSHEYDSEYYYLAQFELGNIYLFKKQLPEESIKFYKQIKYRNLAADNYISAQIILELINQKSCSISKIKDEKELLINNIEKICHLSQKIKNSLIISFKKKSFSNEETNTKNPERRVAHYTRPGVLFNLLKGKNPSKFRLNIVDFMNDPSENQVLTQWLNITTNPDNEIKTFLASFSFNHNSLNQFRLYGNEENILGSGVSIAFNQNFFGQNTERSINMDNINIMNHFSNSISENKDLISSQVNIENNIEENIYPLSIYRCLYFDPKTEYISLAKRNKQSFYLEMYYEKKDTEEIDQEWEKYIEALEEEHKIKTIRHQLREIKDLMQDLLKNEELNKLSNLKQLLSLAVLPISCLIKHAAFEDEDECRMIYITHIADKNIVEPTDYQAANNLYIEYKEIEDYIDKIYLGPQCKMQHKLWLQNHFKKKQTEKEIKLIKSEMPLR
ncbi:hypothetical protein BHC43_08090 [Snodgrassella alvi]|uniref:tetratricopeptide repeat protein n=1 Tax=Snodgrassella alvi TaxID=1196083 RepID=UPI000C1EDD22|nr:tetratricopeptide repeat protein [Snodgrassella alvi]PIT37798.1 hypothetical protein BHC43_08090 [Snodgrassella alvi]